jgi:hypothetical protein
VEFSKIERPRVHPTVVQAASFAYGILLHRSDQVLRAVLLPITVAGLVLYCSLGFYLSELLSFLDSPDPRVASLALGTLAAGFFLCLFFYAMAAVGISDLVLRRPRGEIGLQFRAERQEWRVYAAYLRLLLVVSVIPVAVYLVSTCATFVPFIRADVVSWLATAAGAGALCWLFARVGFLVTSVVAGSEGAVLRRAYELSAQHLWRNCALIAILMLPGFAIQIAGEYALRAATGMPFAGGNLPLADSARLMGDTLGGFLAVASLSVAISIVLLTAGALAVYRVSPAPQPQTGAKKEAYESSLAVLAEKLPE